MITDYSYSILVRQRHEEFAAEAAADRLARLATAGRTPWWQRLQVFASLPPKPSRARGLTARRAAH